MKLMLKRFGTGLAVLAVFGLVLVPATPSQAAPQYTKRAVATNHLVLAKLKAKNPGLDYRVNFRAVRPW